MCFFGGLKYMIRLTLNWQECKVFTHKSDPDP